MDGVVRVTRRASSAKNASSVNQRRTQKSTTLNRKFVKKVAPRPRINASAAAASRTLKGQSQQRVLIRRTQQVRLQPQPQQTIVQQAVETQTQAQQKFAQRAAAHSVSLKDIEAIQPAQDAPIVKIAKARMAARKAAAPQPLTAQELKERAIQQALRKVSTMDVDEEYSEAFKKKHFWQKKKFALAASMAVVSLALLGYLVSVNMPNISVRVAAMHSGIEKAYPSYVPSSYRLDGLVKEENGRITMGFKDDNGKKFTLMEEKSSWDSSCTFSNIMV